MIEDSHRDTPETRHAMMLSSDILVLFARGGYEIDSTLRTIQGMSRGKGADGEMYYPTSPVFDIDDNLDWVHPFNPAFLNLGTRAYNGEILKHGDKIVTTFPDGTEVVVWEDLSTVRDDVMFDVRENQRRITGLHRTARSCEGVTVASPRLADYYRTEHKCQDVYVFPNSVIPEDYPQARLAEHEGVRILWQGGGSHMIDWFPLRDAIREVSLKYPQVKWVIWGSAFAWIHDNIPPEQLELLPWTQYPAYKPTRVLVDADINLCPLVDNEFNRSKSCIKWYEGSILTRPEPTLAAKCRPYTEEMVDGETGLLYSDPKEFVQKLSILIENAELRRKLGENAKRWVLENRHYEKTVPGLFEFYQHLRAKKRLAYEV
jgi:glycosyltransferase involved in cell wall biosynthesis